MIGYFNLKRRELFVPYLFIARREPGKDLAITFSPDILAARVLKFRENREDITRKISAEEIMMLKFDEPPATYYLENILKFTTSNSNEPNYLLFAGNNVYLLFKLVIRKAEREGS